MSPFDWIDFLERHSVEYVTQGPNVGRGEIGVQCPFCGPEDSSQHMSINLEGNGWVCRRGRHLGHKGRAPARLVAALISCSMQEAQRLVGTPGLASAMGALAEAMSIVSPKAYEAPAVTRALVEPREFRKFEGKPSQRPYMRYMEGRGFPAKFVQKASAEMGLRYCTLGPFAGRIIFLVHQDGKLVNWTGRAISSRAKLRYRAHTPDPELAARDGLAPAAMSIERTLLWFDELCTEGGTLLELVEGPMDALKLRMLGRRATCLFTNFPSREQVDLLRELAPRFERRAVLLDRGAEAQQIRTLQELAALGFRASWLPRGADDPGELTAALLAKIGY